MPHKFNPANRARLENPERTRLLPPEDLLRRAGLGSGMRVADVGCGPGFFTLPAARIVGPQGRVYALDISPEMLGAVKDKVQAAGLPQVEIVHSGEGEIPLPDGAVDFALLAFVLHEAVDAPQLAGEVSRVLADRGRILLLEWEKREMPTGPPVGDRLAADVSAEVLRRAGLDPLEHFAPNPLHYGIIAVRRASSL